MKFIIKYSIIISAVLFLMLVPPGIIFRDGASLCIFKNITGMDCSLCGMTRASFEMIHLNPFEAFNLNPLIFFLPVILVVEILFDIYKSRILKKIRRIVFILFLISLLVLFGVRLYQHFMG
jgi:hypothetical protein